MKRLLQSRLTNIVCISMFTGFYTIIYNVNTREVVFSSSMFSSEYDSFWYNWSHLLENGHLRFVVNALCIATGILVMMLVIRRRPYDEYHSTLLTNCLIVATVLTMIAIAVFYLMILLDPRGVLEKFTLFIFIHWTTVILADFVYELLCRWR
ncbi:MAG: hypothetical protein FWG88_03900 [Oscillospiraceae bacterium]|nr:hypothetical protein [Oscillospiraceae bacterium]